MSGPVQAAEAKFENSLCAEVEVREGRAASVGGAGVVRVLPTRGRRTIGPWCFVDLIRPSDAHSPDPMEIGPHPHVGLSTVTWLFGGAVEHSDSLGTTQLIRPGDLNLMSAGRGVAHAEQTMSHDLHGAQMWLAQPEGTRHGISGFEHHSDLPRADLGTGEARVVLGTFAGVTSPARTDWATVGAEVSLGRGELEVAVPERHEHAVIAIDHPVLVEGVVVDPGWLGVVPAGRESIRMEARAERSRLLVIGGEPFGERVQMWWNFVARTRDEITDAWRAWAAGDADRFGPVPSGLERVEAPVPPWISAERRS